MKTCCVGHFLKGKYDANVLVNLCILGQVQFLFLKRQALKWCVSDKGGCRIIYKRQYTKISLRKESVFFTYMIDVAEYLTLVAQL